MNDGMFSGKENVCKGRNEHTMGEELDSKQDRAKLWKVLNILKAEV